MISNSCKLLLIEDNPVNAKLIKKLLSNAGKTSLGQGISFDVTWIETLAKTLEKINQESFDVILLDLILPDSSGLGSLIKVKEYAPQTPVIIQTGSEDESLVVKSFQLGADGYLKKQNLDTNLLIYAIRSAVEKQLYLANLQKSQLEQQQQEFQSLDHLVNGIKTNVTARMFGSQSIKDGLPDIFQEMVQEYGNYMDLALEERAYKVSHNISEKLRTMAEKLGFLKASPRDIIDIHTFALKNKNENATLAKAQAYVGEGRLMVLELMGYLTSYYRKYYIGLSNLNISHNLYQSNNL
jgi:CheY-like chemotaxis protein